MLRMETAQHDLRGWPEPMGFPDAGGLTVSAWTEQLPADTTLYVELPGETRQLTLRQLLRRLFPRDGGGQAEVRARLDRQANPDLPACYAVLLALVEQWRSGLCRLSLATGRGRGRPAHADDRVSAHLQLPPLCHRVGGHADLTLTMQPHYRPLEWAIAQGYFGDRQQLLDWMQSCALLYFVDKHRCAVPPPDDPSLSESCLPVVYGLYRRRCLRLAADGDHSEVAAAGRTLIGALLEETEALIDSFDLFKDARWNEDEGAAEFDTGRGADLRVEAIIAEGLDPVRSVFLLRLYDGSLDPFASQWQRLVGDPAFFDRLLEPVVNRVVPAPPQDILTAIIEDGYALLETRAEAAAASVAQAEIQRRLLGQQSAGAFDALAGE